AGRTEPAPSIKLDTEVRRQWLTEAEVEAIIRQAGTEPGHGYAVARSLPRTRQRAEHQAVCADGRGPVRWPLARLTARLCGSGVSAVQRIKREMTAAAVGACLSP